MSENEENVAGLPKIKVSGRRQNLKKPSAADRAPKPKSSNFLLTINTNQQYSEDDPNLESDVEIFDTSIQSILKHIDHYVKLQDGDTWNDDKIKSVDIDYMIERGLKKGQIHVHVLLKIKHFSKILLDYDKIKSKICGDLGLKSIYMLNKLIRNSGSDNILDYLSKYV